MDIKSLYKKYSVWILVGLLLFSMFKGCQSCNRNNQLKWQEIQHAAVVDSLNDEISLYKSWNDSLMHIISIYDVELKNAKNTNELLVSTNKSQMETNKALIKTNRKLINK